MAAPSPIDPRGPRFNQGVLTVVLLGAFVADVRLLVPVMAVVLFLGAAFGAPYGPFLRLYSAVIRPRLAPPKHLEDPRPPRFAASIGTVFLAVSSIAFLLDAQVLAWALALVVAVLAGLAASSGLCIGCELYLLFARRRGVELVA
ncbi:MAG TPA: DUF4395 domain-containing protein [Acidimicrobiales bacterium]|nr:DUF4395 domain-containing protein [Acidimicrobiales bacterium]